MEDEERKKREVYCSRCKVLIGEVETFNELPEAFKNHVICIKCLRSKK